MKDVDTNEQVYEIFQDGAPLSAIIEAVRGLTDSVARDPTVQGDQLLAPLCLTMYSHLTSAMEAAAKLEQAMDEEQ